MTATPVTTRCRTLVVEDSPDSMGPLLWVVRSLEHDVETATTVAEAMEKLLAWRPQCILLDLMLPDGEGETILRYVRERDLPVRVAVVTALGEPGRLGRLGRYHPDEIFIKPLVMAEVKRWLEGL